MTQGHTIETEIGDAEFGNIATIRVRNDATGAVVTQACAAEGATDDTYLSLWHAINHIADLDRQLRAALDLAEGRIDRAHAAKARAEESELEAAQELDELAAWADEAKRLLRSARLRLAADDDYCADEAEAGLWRDLLRAESGPCPDALSRRDAHMKAEALREARDDSAGMSQHRVRAMLDARFRRYQAEASPVEKLEEAE